MRDSKIFELQQRMVASRQYSAKFQQTTSKKIESLEERLAKCQMKSRPNFEKMSKINRQILELKAALEQHKQVHEEVIERFEAEIEKLEFEKKVNHI